MAGILIAASDTALGTADGGTTVGPIDPGGQPLPIHRWSFGEAGGAGTVLVDSIGGADGTIVVTAWDDLMGGPARLLRGEAGGLSLLVLEAEPLDLAVALGKDEDLRAVGAQLLDRRLDLVDLFAGAEASFDVVAAGEVLELGLDEHGRTPGRRRV